MSTLKHVDNLKLELLMQGKAKNTVETYTSLVKRFLEYHQKSPTNISRKEIISYLLTIPCIATRKQMRGALIQFYVHVLNTPKKMNKIKNPKQNSRLPKIISHARFERGMRQCTNPKHKALFQLLMANGLRVSELISIRRSSFVTRTVAGVEHHYIKIIGKGNKERLCWLSTETKQVLANYIKTYQCFRHTDQDRLLFRNPKTKKKYSASSVQALVKKYFQSHPHALRHTYATTLLDQGVDIHIAQISMGHANIKTTQRYMHTSPGNLCHISAR